MKVIIDTDPGHDDAMAIMLAVKSKIFDIKAITTVSGNSSIENTTRNARYILNLLEREDIPIYSGEERPLERELIRAVVHGESGLEGIDPTNPAVLTGNAVEKIIELADSEEELTIITLGPLTNIARVIQTNPDVMKKINQIVIMGGAIRVPGNKNRVAEFNIFVDPEAADIVFNFPINKTLVPLDACNNVQMQVSDFEKIENEKLRKPVLAMIKPYIENISKEEGVKAALMYDPLTVYYLINPGACKTEGIDIKVETSGELTRGMTVADLRTKSKKKNNVSIVNYIDPKLFVKDFIEVLSRD